jgi:diaminohydroxyphosphoribosylaminopyrimidine deaminase / 5-amino-6-(5-phosphoribosylamino)uracil reductase
MGGRTSSTNTRRRWTGGSLRRTVPVSGSPARNPAQRSTRFARPARQPSSVLETQQADNPHLAVRSSKDDPKLKVAVPVEQQPWRVIVDSNARTLPGARVLDEAAPTLIAVAEDADASHLEEVTTVVRLPRTKQGVDLDVLLRELHGRGVRGMFLESGPTLAASFVSAGLVDRIIAYIAPALLGRGKSALQGGTIETIGDILRGELLDVTRSGPDVRLVARPRRG